MHSIRVTLLFFIAYTSIALHGNSGCVLITSLYNEKNPARAAEYIECLTYNLAHPLIDTIYVAYDTTGNVPDSLVLNFIQQHPEIIVDYCSGRPSFGALFAIANSMYPEKIIIVSNGDIYFDETLASVLDVDLTNMILALGRWNINRAGIPELAMEDFRINGVHVHRPAELSQDVWIFKAPLWLDADDICLGAPHCDHYLAYRIAASGNKLYNPSKSIRCCHLHLSNIRNYAPGGKHIMPSAGIPACTIDEIGNPKIQPLGVSFPE